MKIKNIFFDFDGVIAESVSAKTDAFREMYLPYGKNVASKVVEHHINHGGVSRFEKFKIYHKEFLQKDITEDNIQALSNQFSKLVLQKVINSNEVSGAGRFIERYSKKMKFWVITGTPTPEIEIILNERSLSKYFIGAHGSPKNKRYWTTHLIDKFELLKNETLFLGDASTDFDAAQFSHIHFALRETEENKSLFSNYDGIRFKTFEELEKKINKYF